MHRAGVAVAVDCQGHRVADRHIAADRTGDRHRCRTGRFSAIDRADGIDGDADRVGRRLDRIGLIGRCRRGIAGRVGCRHARMHVVDRGIGQHVAGNADAIRAAGLHSAGIAVAVDRQGHRVAHGHVAADRTRDRHRRRAGAFGRRDRRDRIDRDGDGLRAGFDVVRLVGRCRFDRAGRFGDRHRGMHVVAGRAGQHVARNADAVSAAGLHRAAIAVAVHRQRDGIAHGHVGNRAGNGDWCRTARFATVDRGNRIDRDLRRRNDGDRAGGDVRHRAVGVGSGEMKGGRCGGGAGSRHEHHVDAIAAGGDHFAGIYRRLAVGQVKRAIGRQIGDGKTNDMRSAIGAGQMQRDRLLMRGADVIRHRHVLRRRAGQAGAAGLLGRLRAAVAVAVGQTARRGRFGNTQQLHKAVAAVAVPAAAAEARRRRIEQLVEVAVAAGDGIGDAGQLAVIGGKRGAMRIGRFGGEHAVVDGQRFLLVHHIGLPLAVADLDFGAGRRDDHVALVNRIADLEFDQHTLGRTDVRMPFEVDDFADNDVRMCHFSTYT